MLDYKVLDYRGVGLQSMHTCCTHILLTVLVLGLFLALTVTHHHTHQEQRRQQHNTNGQKYYGDEANIYEKTNENINVM